MRYNEGVKFLKGEKMKEFFTEKQKSKKMFENEKVMVLEQLHRLEPDTEQYSKAVQNLNVLCKACGDSEAKNSIDMNTILTVGGSLIGIVLILHYEKLDVVTSKALGFVNKLKI